METGTLSKGAADTEKERLLDHMLLKQLIDRLEGKEKEIIRPRNKKGNIFILSRAASTAQSKNCSFITKNSSQLIHLTNN